MQWFGWEMWTPPADDTAIKSHDDGSIQGHSLFWPALSQGSYKFKGVLPKGQILKIRAPPPPLQLVVWVKTF